MIYIVAEAGQNHNGSFSNALKLIESAKNAGCDAIKFTKRDMEEELSDKLYHKRYKNEHSYGRTYGQHRQRLELSYDDHMRLSHYARAFDLDFIETLCSPKTVEKLYPICDQIKIASRDANNIPLLRAINATKKPVIISTGMSTQEEIIRSVEELNDVEFLSILYCVSEYPASIGSICLEKIQTSLEYLRQYFDPIKKCVDVGYSDHTIGSVIPLLAVGFGAKVIEKHITLNKNEKGSDHAISLEPDELKYMVKHIRVAEKVIGKNQSKIKLQRSLAYKKEFPKGAILTEKDFIMISPGNGIDWDYLGDNKKVRLLKDVKKNSLCCREEFHWE